MNPLKSFKKILATFAIAITVAILYLVFAPVATVSQAIITDNSPPKDCEYEYIWDNNELKIKGTASRMDIPALVQACTATYEIDPARDYQFNHSELGYGRVIRIQDTSNFTTSGLYMKDHAVGGLGSVTSKEAIPEIADSTPSASAHFEGVDSPPEEDIENVIDIEDLIDDREDEIKCQAGIIGWLVCKLVLFLTDTLNEFILEPLLQSQPAVRTVDGQETVLYKTWSGMLTFANVLLVPLFLIIIFAQALSLNIDAYTIKKTLPRLVVITIALQLSFFLVGFMLDVTNVLGMGIRTLIESTVSGETIMVSGDSAGGVSAGGRVVTEVVLILGTLAVVGFAMGGALLVPLLAGFFAVLAAFFTLVFRQLLIVLMVIIAPIAILAWALPNTEKLFKAWWDNFLKVLLMYPLIQLLIGSGVVAAVLAQEIGGPDAIRAIVALTALIAPLLLIPFTFKMAGAGMGAIASGIGKVSGGIKGLAVGDPKDPNSFAARQGAKTKAKRDAYRAGSRGNALTQGLAAPSTLLGRLPGALGGNTRFGASSRGGQAAAGIRQLSEMTKQMEELGVSDKAAYEFIQNYHDKGALLGRIQELRASDNVEDDTTAHQLETMYGMGWAGSDTAAGAALSVMTSQGFRSLEEHESAFDTINRRVNSNPALKNQIMLQGALKAKEAGRHDVFARHHPQGRPLSFAEQVTHMSGEDWRKAKPAAIQNLLQAGDGAVRADVLSGIVEKVRRDSDGNVVVREFNPHGAELLGRILSPENADQYSPAFLHAVESAIGPTFSGHEREAEIREAIERGRNFPSDGGTQQPPTGGGGYDAGGPGMNTT